MPTNAEDADPGWDLGWSGPEILVDTSAAVPLVVEDHRSHRDTVLALEGCPLGLAGHAAFETFSVLTRLPAPIRRSPSAVQRIIAVTFPRSRFLSAERAELILESLAELGVAGGSVYDALVGATAVEHGMRLVTRDRRATVTYRALDVDFQLLA